MPIVNEGEEEINSSPNFEAKKLSYHVLNGSFYLLRMIYN